MYYEEKVIDGVLCCRFSPTRKFIQLGAREITQKLILFEKRLAESEHDRLNLLNALQKIKDVAHDTITVGQLSKASQSID